MLLLFRAGEFSVVLLSDGEGFEDVGACWFDVVEGEVELWGFVYGGFAEAEELFSEVLFCHGDCVVQVLGVHPVGGLAVELLGLLFVLVFCGRFYLGVGGSGDLFELLRDVVRAGELWGLFDIGFWKIWWNFHFFALHFSQDLRGSWGFFLLGGTTALV